MTNPDAPFCLVTGASQGIGRAMARECARRGWNTALVSLPGENLAAVCQQIEDEFKVRSIFLERDLSQPTAAQEVFEWVNSEKITVNLLINNAGFGTHGPFVESRMGVNQTMIRLNVLNTYHLTHLFLPMLLRQKQAWILNMGSIAGVTPTPYKSLYAATKAFITWFSRALQRELKKTSVHVSCVVPGGVVTNEKVKARIHSAGWLSRKTAVYPEDVARLAIRRMLKRKSLTVPGIGGKIGYVLARYLPTTLGLRILEGPMSKRSE